LAGADAVLCPLSLPPVPACSDESNATTGKRLESVGVENSEDNRRAWRELLYTAPGAW
jgi:fructose-bisphosphate aldolase class 1